MGELLELNCVVLIVVRYDAGVSERLTGLLLAQRTKVPSSLATRKRESRETMEKSPRSDPELQRLLETTWTDRHDTGVGFRYRLNIERERVAPGSFHFLILLNRKRLTERRQPEAFQLDAAYDPDRFNFTRVDPAEVQHELVRPIPTSILINNSPVTLFHSLVVPNRARQCSQLLTPDGVRIAFELLLRLPDRRYRIGYNSPGAQASVNHLHLHLLRIDEDLYVQRAELIAMKNSPYLHRLPDHLPARGYCLVVRDPNRELDRVCGELLRLLETLVQRQMAHNLFWTWTHLAGAAELRVFVFPRVRQCVNKLACSFNAAFLELAGFVSVGTVADYEQLTEATIVRALRDAQGDVYGALRDFE
uniref:GDP-D-glucose phosphorylase 1 n=1 Tax=Anopheles farauti TaxID=69004 RepID=A0A182QEC1_9DIPT